MSAFLFYDPRPVYFTSTGEVCSGGTLKFFEAGTTTPQDVYGDQALTVNNGAVLALGTDGRTSVDVWGDGSLTYRVQLFDSNDALQFDVDNVGVSGGADDQLPAKVANEFLTTDGAQWLMAAIRQLPDPTGQAGKVVSTDGTSFTFVPLPGSASITVSGTSVKLTPSSGSAVLIQVGSDTMPASNAHTASKAVTFPTAFASPWTAVAILRSQSVADHSWLPIMGTIFLGTTGFTAVCDTNSNEDTVGNIIADVPFDWIAIGTVAA